MKGLIRTAISILVIILLMTNLSNMARGEDDIPIIPQESPEVIIDTDKEMPVFKAGETAYLDIPILNRSSTVATRVTVSIDLGDLKTAPFEIDKMNLTRHVSNISGKTMVGFKVKVPVSTKPQIYPINASVSWSSPYGSGGSDSATIYVKIENDLKQPDVIFQNIKFEGERLPAGKVSTIYLNMFNDSDLIINNLEMKLSGFSPNGINLHNWSDTQHVKSMKKNETKPVAYQLYIDPLVETGTYTLDLTYKYQDERQTEYSKEAKVYIPIDGKGAQDDFTPRIIIDYYDFGGDYILAGQSFPLFLSLLNTSETKSIKNLKVSLNSEGGIFSPTGSSNSFFIADLPPGEYTDKTITFKTKPTAENETHNITATLDYQDETGNKYTETEIISILVNQKLQLTTSEVIIPDQVFAQMPTAITLDFYNTGRAVIRNLMITTRGDFETQNGDIYIGNLEAGHKDYYDVTIIPSQEGKVSGVILLEYDDEMGEHYQMEKPFTLTVMAAQEPPMEPGNMEPPPEEKKIKKWMIAAAAGVVLLATGLFIRRIRKKRREVEFDEEI